MSAEFDRLQAFIDSETAEKQSLRILEAGCGSISYIRFKQDIDLTGIDISESQLEDVLEHLSRQELELSNFSQAVSDDGLIVLKMPNVLSVKGLATKIMPHWIHEYAYKYLTRGSNTRDSRIEPFKTYLKFSIAPNAMRKTSGEMGL